MRRKTEGLTFPADPLAAMRDLQDLDANPAASPPPRQAPEVASQEVPPEVDGPNYTAPVEIQSQSYDQSYDHMTTQEYSNKEINSSGPTSRSQGGNTAISPYDQTAIRPDFHTDRRISHVSLRDQIAASVQGAGGSAKTVLKTVTIKLDPELDRRIEDHCYQTGRKKQDVIRYGLLLYFEAVEQIAGKDE